MLPDVTGKPEQDPKRPPAEGTYIMYNQSRKQELPKPSEGPFSQSMALTPPSPLHKLRTRDPGGIQAVASHMGPT